MLFRPVRENDLDDIVRLAARAGVGMTSLPHDVGRLAARIRRSIETFAGELPRSQQGFLFVLEDTALARVVGVSAIEVAVGLDEPFYNFRIQKTVRASKALGVYKPQELLNLSYDHTGHSELCTLFLDPGYQRNRNGLLLSKARFLFIAAFREWLAWLFAVGLIGLGMQITVKSLKQAGGKPLIIGGVVGTLKAVGSLIVVLLFVREFI